MMLIAIGCCIALCGLLYAAVEVPERENDSPETASQSNPDEPVQDPQKDLKDLAITEPVPTLSPVIALSENLV